jgi:hypothetical protein
MLNRLILLVLSLILVCLILIVGRAYSTPSFRAGATAAATAPTDEPLPDVVDNTAPVKSPEPRRSPSRPVVRTARVIPPVPTTEGTSAAEFDSAPVNRELPTTVVTGVGLPPGIVVGPGLAGDFASADVVGFATLLGQPPPEIGIPLTPACGRLNNERPTTRHFLVSPEGRLANVFVWISEGIGQKYSPPKNPAVLDQIGCMYQPYLLGLQTGQRLQVQNSDSEMHNVHLLGKNNPERNLAQLKGGVNSFSFDKREVLLRAKCDVHPWMFAYIGIVEHPFFAVTDTNGLFRLPNGLPAGQYTVSALHQKAGLLAQKFEFRPGHQKAIEFQFPTPGGTQASGDRKFR